MSTWKFDPAHTTVEFVAKHMMITNVKGRFKTFDGEIAVDGEDLETAIVNVTFETASVDTGHDQRDGHLRSPDFFDVTNFPNITFKSTKVEPLGEDLLDLADPLRAVFEGDENELRDRLAPVPRRIAQLGDGVERMPLPWHKNEPQF